MGTLMIWGENVRPELNLCLHPLASTWRRQKILENLIQADHLIREEVPVPRLVGIRAGSCPCRLELSLQPPRLTASSAGDDGGGTWPTKLACVEVVAVPQQPQRP